MTKGTKVSTLFNRLRNRKENGLPLYVDLCTNFGSSSFFLFSSGTRSLKVSLEDPLNLFYFDSYTFPSVEDKIQLTLGHLLGFRRREKILNSLLMCIWLPSWTVIPPRILSSMDSS